MTNIQLIDSDDVIIDIRYEDIEKLLDKLISNGTKIGKGRETSYILPNKIAIMVDYSRWYSEYGQYWHGISKEKCENYLNKYVDKFYIILKCQYSGIFPIPGKMLMDWCKDLNTTDGSWKFVIIPEEEKVIIRELNIDISKYRNKIDILEHRDMTDIKSCENFRWGNKIICNDDIKGNRRISVDFTDISRSEWILDGKDHWNNSYKQSMISMLNIFYDRHPDEFSKLDPHGPRGALYIVDAENIENLTNKGQFAEQISNSNLYVETCLCNNDFAELTLAVARSLGYESDRFSINEITAQPRPNSSTQTSEEEPEDKGKDDKDKIEDKTGGLKMQTTISMEDILLNKKQIILYGPPGTGKTFKARELAERFIKGEFNDIKDKGFVEFIAFHPSYGYEEFIERITVPIEREEELTESGKYELKSGIFKNLCKRALIYSIDRDFQVELQEKIVDKNNRISYRTKKEQISTIIEKGKFNDVTWRQIYDTYKKAKLEKKVNFMSAQKFVLIVDEINRGYISKIFGELITLIEKDKRIGEDNELTASLLYSADKFGVPPNIYIIGTMNTADRSIDLVDIALRRRFGFIEMLPDFSIVENDIKEREKNLKSEGIYQLLTASKDALEIINQRICEDEIGRDRQIGHSYILQIKTKDDLIMAWQYNILPLLDEYCQGDCEKVNQILFVKDNTNWITEKDGIYDFKGDLIKLEEFINQIK